jgi:hypothetical protein
METRKEWIKMELRKLAKPGMAILVFGLTALANGIQSKIETAARKEEIAKEVANYLSNQAKES